MNTCTYVKQNFSFEEKKVTYLSAGKAEHTQDTEQQFLQAPAVSHSLIQQNP